MRSPWEELLDRPHPRGHFVQLYQAGETSLMGNVARYLGEGLRRGEGALVIVTSEHEALLSIELQTRGLDIRAMVDSRQIVFLNAHQTLSQFMTDGQPDSARFESTLRAAMGRVRAPDAPEGLRAFGEMVGILWKGRQFAAAVRLEQLWNRLLEQSSFSLYCGYAVDIFSPDFNAAKLHGLLCSHTHMVPAQSDGALETALCRAMNEILGERAEPLRAAIKAGSPPGWAVMPAAENMLLWLRNHAPDQAEQIVERTRQLYFGLECPPAPIIQ